MRAISSYRGNRLTNTHTHRQDQLQYTAPQLARSVKIGYVLAKVRQQISRVQLYLGHSVVHDGWEVGTHHS